MINEFTACLTLAYSPLLLDEFCTFQKVVLNPELKHVENERIYHHDKEQLKVRMALEYFQDVHGCVDEYICILKHEPEDHEFCDGEGHQPNEQLDEEDLVVYVQIQFFVSVSIDVLGIVKVEVHTTLQNHDFVFLGKYLNDSV